MKSVSHFFVWAIAVLASAQVSGAPCLEACAGTGESRLLVIGNSIVRHAPAPHLGWTNDWGMAASSPERDFAHLVAQGLGKWTGRKIELRTHGSRGLEREYLSYDVHRDFDAFAAWKPDYVVIGVGENISSLTNEANRAKWREALVAAGLFFKDKNPNVKIVYRTTFWQMDEKNAELIAAAKVVGGVVADIGNRGNDPRNQALGLFWHQGVACHPGDMGMRMQSEIILRALGFPEPLNELQEVPGRIIRPRPRPSLASRMKEGIEVYGIVHWGLNTFTDREWGYGDEDPALLNPQKFDADQIVSACRAGGLQGLIVVAKHHDGFCLWPTKTTIHNISKTPFRGGKGDYVREMERACRRFGMKFGVYVSPWDRNNASYGSEKYVRDVFWEQVRELLSGDYGEIFEMWFDGANGGTGHYGGACEHRAIGDNYYRFEELFAFVRSLQPNVCIFNEDDGADYRWPGNERGVLDPDSRATIRSYRNKEKYMEYCNVGDVDGTTFHPCEADFPLRRSWFYHEKDRGTTKNGICLMQRYLSAVGNAGTMNIGIAPDKNGQLDEDDVRALREFGDLQRLFFSNKGGETCNVVVLREDVSWGEYVECWSLLADGRPVTQGKSIGSKRIRLLDSPVKVSSLRVDLTRAPGHPDGAGVNLETYFVDPKVVKAIRESATESGETDTAKWMLVGQEGVK